MFSVNVVCVCACVCVYMCGCRFLLFVMLKQIVKCKAIVIVTPWNKTQFHLCRIILCSRLNLYYGTTYTASANSWNKNIISCAHFTVVIKYTNFLPWYLGGLLTLIQCVTVSYHIIVVWPTGPRQDPTVYHIDMDHVGEVIVWLSILLWYLPVVFR